MSPSPAGLFATHPVRRRHGEGRLIAATPAAEEGGEFALDVRGIRRRHRPVSLHRLLPPATRLGTIARRVRAIAEVLGARCGGQAIAERVGEIACELERPAGVVDAPLAQPAAA